MGVSQQSAVNLNDRLRAADNAARQALEWFDESREEKLTRGPSGGGITIRRPDIERLQELLRVLRERFKLQIEALQKKATK